MNKKIKELLNDVTKRNKSKRKRLRYKQKERTTS